jgi:hypothetical protein
MAYSPQPNSSGEGRVGRLSHESTSIGKKDLQELQDRAPSSHCLRHLFRRPSQAASGLIAQTDCWRVD